MTHLILPGLLACLATMMHSSHAVYVKDGDLTYPLQSVKRLRELLLDIKMQEDTLGKDVVADDPLEDAVLASDPNDKRLPGVDTSSIAVCNNPQLPQEFRPVCQRPDAPVIFGRLMMAIRETDLCEVCASAACAGC